jgi:hypothetical protein
MADDAINLLSPGVRPADAKAARIAAMLQGTRPMGSQRWPIPGQNVPGAVAKGYAMFWPASSTGKPRRPHLAVVTGAGGGIGSALAIQLAELDCALVLVDNDPASLSATAAQCEARGAAAAQWEVDVADTRAVTAMAREVIDGLGAPDALFNLAG